MVPYVTRRSPINAQFPASGTRRAIVLLAALGSSACPAVHDVEDADDAGGTAESGTPCCTFRSSTPPTAVSISPPDATVDFDDRQDPLDPNETLDLVAVFEDADGATNISHAAILISRNLTASESSLIEYRQADDALYIADDTGHWVGGIAPGSTTGSANETIELSNNQFTLDVTHASVSTAGNQLILTLPVRFTRGYAGAHDIRMRAANIVQGAVQYIDWEDEGNLEVRYPSTAEGPAPDLVTLTLHLQDQDVLVPGRINIYDSDHQFYPPRGHVVLPIDRGFGVSAASTEPDLINCIAPTQNGCQNTAATQQWALDADGVVEVTLPVDRIYTIRAARGLEHERVLTSLDPSSLADPSIPQPIVLPQGVDMGALGWMSADSHVHSLLPEAAQWQANIEDLDYTNLMFMGTSPGSTLFHDHFTGMEEVSAQGKTTYVAEEVRDMLYGHITTLGLQHHISDDNEFGICNEQGICDPHKPLMWETFADVHAQGGLSYHAHADYWPGHGIGLSAVDEHVHGHEWLSPAFNKPRRLRRLDGGTAATGDDHDEFNYPFDHRKLIYDGTDLYYSMLNSGLQVPLIGGTDKMGRYTPVGGTCRTYAKVPTPGHTQWLDAAQHGRTFVTNGPLITSFQVDGQEVGAEISIDQPTTVTLDGSYWSAVDIDSFEVVVNGEVVHSEPVAPGSPPLSGQIAGLQIPIDHSSWIALRAYSNSQDFDEIWYQGLYGARAGAHTSPIYVTMTDELGDPIPVGASAYDPQLMLDYTKGTTQWIQARQVPDHFETESDKAQALDFASRTADYFEAAIDYAYVDAGLGSATIAFLETTPTRPVPVSSGSMVSVTDPVLDGAHALMHTAGDGESYTTPYYGVTAATLDVNEPHGFEFSAYARAEATVEDPDPSTSVELFVFCNNGSVPAKFFSKAFTATGSWQELELRGICPASAGELGVRLDVNDPHHTVFWDKPLLVVEPNLVGNGDFEDGTLAPFGPSSAPVPTSGGGQLSIETLGPPGPDQEHFLRHSADNDLSYTTPYYGTKVADVDPSVPHSFRFSASARGEQPNAIRLLVACELDEAYVDPTVDPTDPHLYDDPYVYVTETFEVSTSWDSYAMTGTCPIGTEHLRIRLEKVHGDADPTSISDVVYWDDLVLSVLE